MIKDIAKNRRTTKRYSDKKIDEKTLNYILETTIDAPSSIGLEGWDILNITSKEWRDRLEPYFDGNNKHIIQTASNIMIFVSKNANWVTMENESFKQKVLRQSKKIAEKYNAEFNDVLINNTFEYIKGGREDQALTEWLKRQPYIAISFMMLSAKEQGVNSTPMEGFLASKVTEKLREFNIIDETENVVVSVALGYPSEEEYPYEGKERTREDWTTKVKNI